MIAVRAVHVAVGLLVIRQAIVLAFAPPGFMLPAPWKVFNALIGRSEPRRVHAVTTAVKTVIGLGVGGLLGRLAGEGVAEVVDVTAGRIFLGDDGGIQRADQFVEVQADERHGLDDGGVERAIRFDEEKAGLGE